MSPTVLSETLVSLYFAICSLLPDLQKKNKAVRENEILKIKEEYSSRYISNAKTEYNTVSKQNSEQPKKMKTNTDMGKG